MPEKIYQGPFSNPKPKAPTVFKEYEEWTKDPSNANLGKVVTRLKPTIEKAATTVAGDKAPAFMPKAILMATDYIKSFDPRAGMSLSSYVTQGLRGMHRVKAERSSVIHVPEEVSLLGNKLRLTEKELQDQLGRDPTVEELADKTGIPVKRIADVRKRKAVLPGSKTTGEEGDDLFGRASNMEKTWAEMVYQELDPHGKKIYEWTTGYGGTETLPKMEIAKRLRISPAAVSQRINTITRRLEDCPGVYRMG